MSLYMILYTHTHIYIRKFYAKIERFYAKLERFYAKIEGVTIIYNVKQFPHVQAGIV